MQPDPLLVTLVIVLWLALAAAVGVVMLTLGGDFSQTKPSVPLVGPLTRPANVGGTC